MAPLGSVRIERIETRGEPGELEREVRHRPARALPAHEIETAPEIALGLFLREHRLSDRVERRRGARPGELSERSAHRCGVLLHQKVPRRARHARPHRPRRGRVIAEPEQPAPDARERVAVQIGAEVLGDRARVLELGQHVYELEERRAQPLVGEGAAQQRSAYATGAEEGRPRADRFAVEAGTDFAGERLDPLRAGGVHDGGRLRPAVRQAAAAADSPPTGSRNGAPAPLV